GAGDPQQQCNQQAARIPLEYRPELPKGACMRSILGSLGLTVLLVTVPVHTDSRRFDLDDLSRVVRISDPQFAPDGHSIVAVISRANLDEDRWEGELASIEVGGTMSPPKMMTSGRKGVGSPRFSPDGSKIAFLMMDGPAKDAHLQVFTMGTG